MAPEAELRNRFHLKGKEAAAALTEPETTKSRICKTHELEGHEVAIEGIIYDITSFYHPGGDSIRIFGGNDVTVQYKMIHPFHSSKQLEKMKKLGIVEDYKTDYQFGTPFEREIKKEVYKIVPKGNDYGTWGYFIRATFYILLLAVCEFIWVRDGSSVPLAIVLGISQAFIGLNVQHDGNHGAASKKPWVNDFLGFGADFIGGSKWLWMEQHWTHHAYTNHHMMDPDSFSAEPMLLFNDYPLGHPARKWYHSFQAFFFLPALSFYWLSSVFNAQILDLKHRGAEFTGMKLENDFISSRKKYAIAIRAFYIYMNVISPFQHHGPFTAIFHFMLMGVSESLVLSTLFSLSHNFEGSNRDPTTDFRVTGEPVCWFKSQVETSSTYGSHMSGWLTGGLNFQIEHHLFPRMSSAWYPYIAPKVREICEKHGVQYAYYPWIHQNLISTFAYIHQAGIGSNWELDPLSGN